MIGIIYYKNYNNGKEQFNKIIENYKKYGVEPDIIHTSSNSNIVHFQNGDVWRTMYCNNKAMGTKWNIAYIEHIISNEERDLFIYPYRLLIPWYATKDYYDNIND